MFLATTACTGGGTAYRTVSGAGRGGLPLRRRFTLPLIEPFCPHPSDPRSKSALPTLGKGEIIVIFCKGLRPLHPCVCAEDGTAYRAVYGTGRGLAPALVGSALPLPVSVGVSAPCVAGSPCLRLNLFAPSPRPPSPAGKGEIFVIFARGFAPCIPASAPGRHGVPGGLRCRKGACARRHRGCPAPSVREGADIPRRRNAATEPTTPGTIHARK